MRTEIVGSSLGGLAVAAAERDAPSYVIDELVSHEGEHASKDTEGMGVFGLLLVSGIELTVVELNGTIEVLEREVEIVVGAFYRWFGERSPEVRKRMAEAVGQADMSQADRAIRDEAEAEMQDQERREWLARIAGKAIIGTFKQGEKGTIFDRKADDPHVLPLAA